MYNEVCLFFFLIIFILFRFAFVFFLGLFVCLFVFFVSFVRQFFQQRKIHFFEFYNSFPRLKVSCSFISLKVDSR